MARRTLNRMELRRAAETADARADGGSADASEPAPKKEPKAKTTKPRKTAKSKAQVKMRVRWAVVNDSLKQVAVFDYPQKSEAEQKAADLMEKGKGHHFVRGVKEPMPETADAAS